MPSESDLACLASSSPVFPVPRTLNWAVLREDESDPSSLRAMAFPDHPLIGSRQSSQMRKPLDLLSGEARQTRQDLKKERRGMLALEAENQSRIDRQLVFSE